MVACINSAAFMVHRPVLTSNLHPVFEVLPPPPVLPQSEGMDSHTLSYKVTVKLFCLSVLYVAQSSAHGLDAYHLFIM